MRRCASRIATRRISWMDHGTGELGDERRFWGDPLASRRTRASIAKASITKLTCRCQPCHERLSERLSL